MRIFSTISQVRLFLKKLTEVYALKSFRYVSSHRRHFYFLLMACLGIFAVSYAIRTTHLAGLYRLNQTNLQALNEKMVVLEDKLERIYSAERELWDLIDPSIIVEDYPIEREQSEPKYDSSSLGHLQRIEVYCDRVLSDLEYMEKRLKERQLVLEHFPTQMPLIGLITSKFGYRSSPFEVNKRKLHKGVDIAAPYGRKIHAAGKGVVRSATYVQSYGNFVDIDHGNGLISRYAHVSKLLVREGEIVMPGQVIAKVGSSGRSTGPHLHFEVLLNEMPVDPEDFLFVKPPYSKELAGKEQSKESIAAVGGEE
ncbi:MAG: M23 family metallopeptidase [Bdellovibrionota bacterium]